MNHVRAPLTVLLLGVSSYLVSPISWALAADPSSQGSAAERLIQQHCFACHSGDSPEGMLRLDALPRDFADEARRRVWSRVARRIERREMPPADKSELSDADRGALVTAIRSQLDLAERARRAVEGRVTLRRLNRIEYENTVRDLLGINIPLRDRLPLDGAAHGFDNVGEAQHVSSFLMDKYLEAAYAALDVAIANGPQPPVIKKRYSLQETHQVRVTTESVFRKRDDGGVVMFSSSPWQSIVLSPFYPPDRGVYRFRLSTSGTQSVGKPVTYRVDAGLMLMTGKPHLVGYFDAPADESRVVEFTDELEARETIRILPYALASAQSVHKIGAEKYEGPGLTVDWVEVEGPLYDTWPPASHRRIFGDLPQKPAPAYNQSKRVEVISESPRSDTEQILRRFARRAYRRPVTDEELQPIYSLVAQKLEEGHSFELATRVGLAAILVSPDFLFLREAPGTLNNHALACRLSYFLWNTMPDDELFTAADAAGAESLANPEVLRAQVERLLKSPKSESFAKNFVGQWLGLRDIDFTIPSHILYPEYDEMLKVSMVRETELFFTELLREDLSVENFLASDFSMLNGRLAKHYGITGVEGWEFQRIKLPLDSHRGGVMTMASVLKVTANGTSTSPVTRGAWVLDRILGQPPPPPPENIAAIEPDIRGAKTIRQLLAKHRDIDACASCHRTIDPPGFALESFDVIGGWRTHYRTSGNGKPVTLDGRRMPYLEGPPVDPTGELEDGRSFQNIDQLKQLLLEDKPRFVRALTIKLLTYGTGAAPESLDDTAVDAIVAQASTKDYGFRSLIHAIVASELFRQK